MVKTVNGECQLQALVDKKKVLIIKTSIRSDLHLEDAGGIDCLPTATIFEELARMGYEKPSPKLTFYKAFFSPQWKFFIHTITQCLSAKTTAWNELKPMTEKETNEESVPKHSYDLSQSGEDRMQLHELMNLCTKLFDRIFVLETTKTTQALEIANLKSRVKKLEKHASKRTHKFKRLYRVGTTRRVKSSNNEDALISDEVFTENDMTEKEHDVIHKEVSAAEILTTAGITIPSIATTAPSTIPKAKGITFRDGGESTTRTLTSISSSSVKDKGKAKMDEPEVQLKKKDQIALDEEMDRNLKAQIQAKLIKEERLARKKEEEANIALIES
ncbi:hypothetical protein Tco_0889063 [Tanacetum coccineum]